MSADAGGSAAASSTLFGQGRPPTTARSARSARAASARSAVAAAAAAPKGGTPRPGPSPWAYQLCVQIDDVKFTKSAHYFIALQARARGGGEREQGGAG